MRAGGAAARRQIGHCFAALQPGRQLADQPDEHPKNKEPAGRQHEHGDGGDDPRLRPAENRAVAEEFPDGPHDDQCPGEARAHAQPVQGGQAHAVFAGEGLGPAQNDAVDDDQRQIDAQRLVDIGQIGLDQHLHDGGEARDNHDVGGQPHLVRDHPAQQGNDDVGADQHEGGRRAHAQPVDRRRRHRQRRAGAQYQAEHRVFLNQALGKRLSVLVHDAPPPFVMSS